MKTSVLIILPAATVDTKDEIAKRLEPYRHREEPDYFFGRWDYWTTGEPGLLEDSGLIKPNEPRFSRLGAVVDLQGKWHDIEDFGWKLVNEELDNKEPLRQWRAHLEKVLRDHEGLLGVVITAHR
jgi:hypothetical protein